MHVFNVINVFIFCSYYAALKSNLETKGKNRTESNDEIKEELLKSLTDGVVAVNFKRQTEIKLRRWGINLARLLE